MKVSKNFQDYEFACHCPNDCGYQAIDIRLLDLLQQIRDHYNKPVHVHCAHRCPEHNKNQKSKPTSQHIRGVAADFHINGVDPMEIYTWLDTGIMNGKYGLGVYDDFIHIDVRKGEKARWNER